MMSCKNNNSSEDSEELVRAKLALSTEFETLSHLCNGEVVTYHSHTYFTIIETDDGGHCFAGKIYFSDKYGSKYYANYDAFVGRESWYPEITISAIEPLINWENN